MHAEGIFFLLLSTILPVTKYYLACCNFCCCCICPRKYWGKKGLRWSPQPHPRVLQRSPAVLSCPHRSQSSTLFAVLVPEYHSASRKIDCARRICPLLWRGTAVALLLLRLLPPCAWCGHGYWSSVQPDL